MASSSTVLTLYNNDFKKESKHPDWKGTGYMGRDQLQMFAKWAKANPGKDIPLQCALWRRQKDDSIAFATFELKYKEAEQLKNAESEEEIPDI